MSTQDQSRSNAGLGASSSGGGTPPSDPWASSWDTWESSVGSDDAAGGAADEALTSTSEFSWSWESSSGASGSAGDSAAGSASGSASASAVQEVDDFDAAITTNSLAALSPGPNEPDPGWRPQGWTPENEPDTAGSAPAGPSGPRAGDLISARARGDEEKLRASGGWRKALGLGPGPKERVELSRIDRIRRPLDGRKTVMVINTKGGGGKTLVSLMLATYLGRYRTGSVLAWDNNETEGTLGMRAPSAPHHRTVVDLLGGLPALAQNPTAGPSELGRYVREQKGLGFDVLASADDDEAMRIVGEQEFEELHAQLSRFYRMIVIDTGNNRLSPNWLAAVRHADVLVFATSLKDDTSVVAAKNLDALVAAGREDLVRNAVCVISHTSPRADVGAGQHTREHFERWVRAVCDIPYDSALAPGLNLDPTKVAPRTHEACLEMTASVVDGL